MDNKYTLEDIGRFIVDYKETRYIKPKAGLVSIPLVGKKMYEKAALEDQKRVVFEKAYNNAVNGTPEEQQQFIIQMTPVLDDFYSKKESRKGKKY